MSDVGQPGQPQDPSQGQPPPPPPSQGQPPPPQGAGAPGQPTQQGGQQGGLDPKLGGLLAYLFSWVSGLIIFLTQKDLRLKFHGMQSILLSVAVIALFVLFNILGAILGQIPGLGFITWIITLVLSPLLSFGALALWIFMMVKAYNLEMFKLPIIGDLAENIARNNAT